MSAAIAIHEIYFDIYRVASRLKIIVFKRYGDQKNAPKMKERKRKWLFSNNISQVNKELPCVLFERTSYTAKKKYLKACKII